MVTHPKPSVQVYHLSCLQISLQSGTRDVSLYRLDKAYGILPRNIPLVKSFFENFRLFY